ncbi:hypothetical protein [Idiomarina baltica]|uniref:Uncharacterized protein n=1 Tax=Idiomarina baltica OS145 TaxID=314276 RepID=A0ABP2CR01_9GAMM|nr:hypothetical protein [Idiomarina baltica]EAQ32293.1 hypothetical protein OS145_07591 [Idiomarina baltica OS145]
MKSLVYFDHNILNAMVRGGESKIAEDIKRENLLPVFSDENLDEISISVNRKEQFLDLYARLGAWHLHVPVDSSFTTIEQFVVSKKSPHDRLTELNEARKGYENVGKTNLDFLSLFYGGGGGKLPSEIALEGIQEAEKILLEQLKNPDLDFLGISYFKKQAQEGLRQIESLKGEIVEAYRELDERAKLGSLTEQAQEDIGIGPLQLNNITGPGVIRKIWSMVGPHYGPNDLSIDDFLIRVESFNSNGLRTLPEIVSRANGIYNLLNLDSTNNCNTRS